MGQRFVRWRCPLFGVSVIRGSIVYTLYMYVNCVVSSVHSSSVDMVSRFG